MEITFVRCTLDTFEFVPSDEVHAVRWQKPRRSGWTRCSRPIATSCAAWAPVTEWSDACLFQGIGFLKLGWWVVHVIAILLVYQSGYNKGRGDERREQRVRELGRGSGSGTGARTER